MSIAFQLTLDPSSQRYLATLESAPAQARQQILRTLDAENQLTIAWASERYLSQRGTKTLGVVSNRLRSSLRASKSRLLPDGSVHSAIGSNVAYAGMHEFGFDGMVVVTAHRMKNRWLDVYLVKGKQVLGWELAGTGIKRAKRLATGVSFVGEHTRHMHMPERSYIRRSLSDRAEVYRVSIGKAVAAAILGGNN